MASPELVRPVKIYCYYSNNVRDQMIWEELKRHFGVLIRLGRIKLYDCHEILPGSDIEQRRDIFLSIADIVLPLISSNFFDDDFCWDMMYLTKKLYDEGKIKLVPIRLRPIYYKGTPFEGLQALPTGKPITGWKDSQEAFEDIIKGIDELVRILHKEWEKPVALGSFETVRFLGTQEELE